MSETTARTQAPTSTGYRGNLEATRSLLQLVYGLLPIIAGLDKFANLLTTWPDYLPSAVVGLLPMEPGVFMYVIGVIEVVAGLLVLSRYAEYGAYLVAGWLSAIALVLLVGGHYDVAVRDLVMAVGAVALAQLVAAQGGS